MLGAPRLDVRGRESDVADGRRVPRPQKMTLDPPYLIFNWLVLLCIDSYDSERRRILQHFSRSTRFAFFSRPYFSKFCKFSTIYFQTFDNFC